MKVAIITRVGDDTESVSCPGETQVEFHLDQGAASDVPLHQIRDALGRLGAASSPIAEDFVVLALTVFAADTRTSREHGHDEWTREIHLLLPVSDPERWMAVGATLERALRFLTGDLWSLSFRPARARLPFPTDRDLSRTPAGAAVTLFSGGLDSFIGALDLAASGKPLVLVSHYTDGSASVPQASALSHINSVTSNPHQIGTLASNIVARRNLFGLGNDKEQRGRSILFIALGTLVALGVDAERLIVPENGLISLNIPLTDLRVGSYSTRTTHPYFIALLQEALYGVGLPITLENPYQFLTKGEMLIGCAIQTDLAEGSATTMSCAHATQSHWTKGAPAVQHCGRCTACLIRRAAFVRAKCTDLTAYSLLELDGRELRSNSAQGRDVRSVRMAARRVIDNPELAQLLILKPGPLGGHYVEYGDVYLRGMRELWALVEHAKTRGAY